MYLCMVSDAPHQSIDPIQPPLTSDMDTKKLNPNPWKRPSSEAHNTGTEDGDFLMSTCILNFKVM